jgi:hypothetical protein
MPQSNSYPTGQWQPGEIVADAIEFDLDQLPAGVYQLVFGFYENLGERFPRLAAEAGSATLPDDRVALPESVVVTDR